MKRISLRLALLSLLAAAGFSSLTACHTAAGLGEDVKDAGRGIERAVDRAR